MDRFYAGQEVVSLITIDHGSCKLVKNRHYFINDIKEGCVHYPVLIDVGLISINGLSQCGMCGHQSFGKNWWIDARLFAPLEDEDTIPESHEIAVRKLLEESFLVEV